MRNRQTSMIFVSSKHVRDFKTNKWWGEKASQAEKNNGKLRTGSGGGGIGNFKEHWRPEQKHSEKQSWNPRGGEGEEPAALRTRNGAQVPTAAEAKPPRDAAPLGCCCACAGGPGARIFMVAPSAEIHLGFETRALFVRLPAGSLPFSRPGTARLGKGLKGLLIAAFNLCVGRPCRPARSSAWWS